MDGLGPYTNLILATGVCLGLGAGYLYLQKKNTRDQAPLALLQAAKDGKVDQIKFWAASVSSVDSPVTAEDEDNALMIALKHGNSACVKELLLLGADINATNVHQFTPLHTACQFGCDLETFKLLLSKKPKVDAVDQNAWTALHVATSKGNLEFIKLLLDTGAQLNNQTAGGECPVLIASNNGFLDCVNFFISKKADLSIRRGQTMDSALILAVWNGHIEVAKALLAADKSLLTLPMSDGAVALHCAAGMGNIKMIDLLVEEFGCDVNVCKRDGENAIHVAVRSEKRETSVATLQRLLDLGCKLTAKDRFGCTPLHRACMKKNIDVVRMFLEAGAPPNIADNDGLSAMHCICQPSPVPEDAVTVLDEMLKHGGELRVGDRVGASLLHYAVSRQPNLLLINKIIELDPTIVFALDKSERTPLHIVCTMYKNPEVQKLLEDHMKKLDPSFFKTFEPTHRLDIDKRVITTTLDQGDQFAVLDGDVSLKGIAKKIKDGSIKNVIVLTGAGISTNAGIADFRGEKGIYKNQSLKERYGISPSQMFSVSTLHGKPDVFYKALKEIFLPVYRGQHKPTLAHAFIAGLEEKGILLRNFTQNIDTLERIAGVSADKRTFDFQQPPSSHPDCLLQRSGQ